MGTSGKGDGKDASGLRGAGRIIAVGTRPICSELAREYGANDIVSYKEGDIVSQVAELTGGRMADSVIIAGGGSEQLANAYRMCRPGGGIGNLIAMDNPNQFEIDTAHFARFVGSHRLSGSLCPGGRRRAERLLDLIRYGRIDPSLLLTHKKEGLDGCKAGFELMCEKPADLVKPIVYMNV